LAILPTERGGLFDPLAKIERGGSVASSAAFGGTASPSATTTVAADFALVFFGATGGVESKGALSASTEPRFKGGDFVTFIIGPILGDKPIRIKHTPRGANRLKTNGDWPRRKQTFYFRD
jgi:hypothetical protein